MPPPNDNFANAIVLTSVKNAGGTYDEARLHVEGDNICATAETGEQPGYAKSVWYKWIAPDPSVANSVWRIMTGWNELTGAPPTDFDTILLVYKKANTALPWSITNLAEILRSDAAAGWEKGSEVRITISAGDEYYIRIDGKQWDPITKTFLGAEGHFSLSWRSLQEVRLLICAECAPENGVGFKCLGVVTPNILAEGFPGWGFQPKGSYLVKYCGGAWNYRDGWVVTRVPQGADKTWPGNLFGWFCTLFAGPTQITFQEGEPPHLGWPNQATAEASARCIRASFELTNPATIQLHFTDEEYDDNSPGTQLPHYGLYQLTPILQVSSTGIFRNGAVGTTRYTATIGITNLTQGVFSNILFTLAATGGVSAPSAAVSRSFNPGGQSSVTFTYDMLPMGKTDGALTIHVTHPVYDPLPDLVLSLVPMLTTSLLIASRVFRSGPVTQVYLNVGNKSAGPTYDLNAVVTATGADGLPVTVLSDDTGAPQSTFDLGEIPTSLGNGNFRFDLRTLTGASVTIAFHDTLMDYPPASVGIPSV